MRVDCHSFVLTILALTTSHLHSVVGREACRAKQAFGGTPERGNWWDGELGEHGDCWGKQVMRKALRVMDKKEMPERDKTGAGDRDGRPSTTSARSLQLCAAASDLLLHARAGFEGSVFGASF